VDEEVYPEHYRKSEYVKGNNYNTPDPFQVSPSPSHVSRFFTALGSGKAFEEHLCFRLFRALYGNPDPHPVLAFVKIFLNTGIEFICMIIPISRSGSLFFNSEPLFDTCRSVF
jgi:hypothetical protein